MKTKIISTISLIALGLFLSIGVSYLQAQTTGTSGGLINTGATGQIKNGGLVVSKDAGSFQNFGSSYLLGTNTYVGSAISGGTTATMNVNGDMYVESLAGATEKEVCADGSGKLVACQ